MGRQLPLNQGFLDTQQIAGDETKRRCLKQCWRAFIQFDAAFRFAIEQAENITRVT